MTTPTSESEEIYDDNFVRHFWDRVNVLGEEACWEWIAGCDSYGYGTVWIPSIRKVRKCHRVSYEMMFGYAALDQCVLHRCDNPKCVNPHHLFTGTQVDNIIDMKNKGRISRGENHFKAKLTIGDIKDMINLWRVRNITQAKIAEMYGVSNQQVSRIVNGKSWSFISGE